MLNFKFLQCLKAISFIIIIILFLHLPGLFHRAIAESGTSYNGWAVAAPGLAKTNCQKLAKLLSCPIDTTAAAVSCLKAKNETEIAASITKFLVSFLFNLINNHINS